MELQGIALEMNGFLQEVRNHLHQNPETRWEEEDTLGYIKSRIDGLKWGDEFEWIVTEYKGGLVLDIRASHIDAHSEFILFRADIDALPIQEKTDLPYASRVPGKMHACGHDVHAAILLAAIKAIAEGELMITRNIRCVFQRAEENPGTPPQDISGGKALVDDNVLENVSHVYGLHIWAKGESGKFMTRPGAILGNSGRVQIDFTWKDGGGHVAYPHVGGNAAKLVLVAANVIEIFKSNLIDPLQPYSLELTGLQAGQGLQSSNIMPAVGSLTYAVRTMLKGEDAFDYKRRIEILLRNVLENIPGVGLKFHWKEGHPSTVNDSDEVRWVKCLLENCGQVSDDEFPPILGGEDFSYFLKGKPGCFWFLGADQEGCGGHHQPTFNPDPCVFWKGCLYWLLIATADRLF